MAKYLIACDSFKECLSSLEIAQSVERGIFRADPSATIDRIAIADGGEGFVEAMARTIRDHGTDAWVDYYFTACDPLGRPVQARYGAYGTTAVIETASASGLALLTHSERNPLLTSSFGTGQQIRDAIDKGYRRIVVGLGGSATNDAGTGMLEALGYRFLGRNGEVLRPLNGHFSGSDLARIKAIDASGVSSDVAKTSFIIACDVTNPLYGPSGASYVFGPQKGAQNDLVEALDEGLRSMALAFDAFSGSEAGGIQSRPGSGAAGGLGAAFMAVLRARPERGIELVLDAARFDESLEGVTMVITGEGHMDSQTLEGKAPMGVLCRASEKGVPVLTICGRLDDSWTLKEAGFAEVLEISDRTQPLSVQLDPAVTSIRIADILSNYISLKS